MTQSYTPLSRPFAVATPQLSFEMDPIVQITPILFGFAWLDITDGSSATAVSSAQARHAPFEVNWQQLQAVPAKQRGSLKQHNTFGLFNYLLSGSIWYSWSPKLSCQGLIPTSKLTRMDQQHAKAASGWNPAQGHRRCQQQDTKAKPRGS